MYCIKCGNEAENNQLFCNHCLAVMDRYPVNPGTKIQLPRRRFDPVEKKQPKHHALSQEEQLVRMRVTIRTLAALLGVAILAFAISLCLNFMPKNAETAPPESSVGQNYSPDPNME